MLELTEEDMKGVAEIEKELSSDDFVYGKNPNTPLFESIVLKVSEHLKHI